MLNVEIRRKKDKSLVGTFSCKELPERRLERMALLAEKAAGFPELGSALAEIRKMGYELYEWTTVPAPFGWRKYPDRNQKGENNANYGRKWGPMGKKKLSRKMKEIGKLRRGKRNVAKRHDVRRKISLALSGEGNPNSATWYVRFPDGRELVFRGGIHRFLKSVGLTYYKMVPVIKGSVEEIEGWCVKRLLEGDLGNIGVSGKVGNSDIDKVEEKV